MQRALLILLLPVLLLADNQPQAQWTHTGSLFNKPQKPDYEIAIDLSEDEPKIVHHKGIESGQLLQLKFEIKNPRDSLVLVHDKQFGHALFDQRIDYQKRLENGKLTVHRTWHVSFLPTRHGRFAFQVKDEAGVPLIMRFTVDQGGYDHKAQLKAFGFEDFLAGNPTYQEVTARFGDPRSTSDVFRKQTFTARFIFPQHHVYYNVLFVEGRAEDAVRHLSFHGKQRQALLSPQVDAKITTAPPGS